MPGNDRVHRVVWPAFESTPLRLISLPNTSANRMYQIGPLLPLCLPSTALIQPSDGRSSVELHLRKWHASVLGQCAVCRSYPPWTGGEL